MSKQINKLKSLFFGDTPIYLANNGNPVDEVIIRYKDFYFSVMIDCASGDPTGEFGWTHGSPMTHVPVREFYTAVRDSKEESVGRDDG